MATKTIEVSEDVINLLNDIANNSGAKSHSECIVAMNDTISAMAKRISFYRHRDQTLKDLLESKAYMDILKVQTNITKLEGLAEDVSDQ